MATVSRSVLSSSSTGVGVSVSVLSAAGFSSTGGGPGLAMQEVKTHMDAIKVAALSFCTEGLPFLVELALL
ncbi:hypothetical protein Cst04h_22790 [Corynebacterium striatum]|uniref:Secreted protein n=1 Tax=Corynebacterium striatum TaxID=43770 RepID=A0ABC9ZPU4_CORST|nr:hypothetical protein Cst04h_22790 [Corynebacterium striatum]